MIYVLCQSDIHFRRLQQELRVPVVNTRRITDYRQLQGLASVVIMVMDDWWRTMTKADHEIYCLHLVHAERHCTIVREWDFERMGPP